MTIRALGLAAFLTAGSVCSGLAATGETAAPTTPTMSSPNPGSHDGNNRIGQSSMNGPDVPHPYSSHGNAGAGTGSNDGSNPSNSPGCGGTC